MPSCRAESSVCSPKSPEDLSRRRLRGHHVMQSRDCDVHHVTERRDSCEVNSSSVVEIGSLNSGLHKSLDALLNNTSDKSDSLHWSRCHASTWSSGDVLDWIYHQASVSDIDLTTLKGEQFQDLTGDLLSAMTRLEFRERDPECGDILYERLHDLLSEQTEAEADGECWIDKPVTAWCSGDVLDWVYHVASSNSINLASLKGENFQDINGRILGSMTLHDFLQRDEEYGDILYNSLQHLLTKSVCDISSNIVHSTTSDDNNSQAEENTSDISYRINETSSHFVLKPANHAIPEVCLRSPFDEEDIVSWREMMSCIPHPSSTKSLVNNHKRFYQNEDTIIPDGDRPVSRSNSSDSDSIMMHLPPKKRKQSSKTRLWQFMKSLLDDPQYNPECIRWENQSDGVFRIVSGRSKIIADLWGKIKNNPTMTFDKLGRSLRWCRANNGLFSAVPKDGKFPKKLCFRLDMSTPPTDDSS